jgi:serine protease Do
VLQYGVVRGPHDQRAVRVQTRFLLVLPVQKEVLPVIATQQGNRRIGWLVALLALLAFVALGIPGRMVTQWAYAVERGKLQADSEELATVSEDLARLQEVSHAFRLVAKVAGPGVVHIRVSRDEKAHERIIELNREHAELSEQLEIARRRIRSDSEIQPTAEQIIEIIVRLREIAEELEVLAERVSPGSGSGIVFDQDGHVLTNNHVVAGRSEIRVILPGDEEREYQATIVGTDPNTDLALLRIDAPNLHPLKFGDSDQMQVGDWVVAVGAPFGLSQSVTHGIISATGRSDVLAGRGIIYPNFLQTDAAINPGNSGGPLLNLRGEVIGVNTAIATNAGESYNAGIAFTIPSNLVVKIANQLKERGEVARGWLGITMGELTAPDREIFGIADRRGVLVDAVIEGSPADGAGLLVEDVILSVNGKSVANMAELRGLIADISPGEKAKFSLLRDGERSEITVALGRRPRDDEEFAAANTRARRAREFESLGFYARTLLPDLAPRVGYTERDRGAVIVALVDDEKSRPALEPGELIVACNDKPVETVAALAQALKARTDDRAVKLELINPQGDRRVVEYKRK